MAKTPEYCNIRVMFPPVDNSSCFKFIDTGRYSIYEFIMKDKAKLSELGGVFVHLFISERKLFQ